MSDDGTYARADRRGHRLGTVNRFPSGHPAYVRSYRLGWGAGVSPGHRPSTRTIEEEAGCGWSYATEQLDYKPTERIGGQELYDDYNYWCIRNGFKPKNITQVAKEWRRIGLKDMRSNGRVYWVGAKLKGINPNV